VRLHHATLASGKRPGRVDLQSAVNRRFCRLSHAAAGVGVGVGPALILCRSVQSDRSDQTVVAVAWVSCAGCDRTVASGQSM